MSFAELTGLSAPPEFVERALDDMRRQNISLDSLPGASYRGLSAEEVVDMSVMGHTSVLPAHSRPGVAYRSLLERTARH